MNEEKRAYHKPRLTAKNLRLGIYGCYGGQDDIRVVPPVVPPVVKPGMDFERS